MSNNQSLEISENFCALARNFVCDPSRIIDTQAGFLIHSLHARNFFFQIFSSSISSFLTIHMLFWLPFSSRHFRVIRPFFYIPTFTSPITTIKWWCLDPPLRNPEQTLPGTVHIWDPGRPSAIFSTPLRPTALQCLPCLFRQPGVTRW